MGDNEMEVAITGAVMPDAILTQCTLSGKAMKENVELVCSGAWENCQIICP